MFDYGHKSAADQMKTSWEKLVQYAGTNYGQYISNELQNKSTVIIVEPVHSDDVMAIHGVRVVMIQSGQMNIQRAHKGQDNNLQAAVDKGEYMDTPMNLAILQNEIVHGELAANIEVPVELNDSEKTQFGNEWCTY
jgi:hypothetical protein